MVSMKNELTEPLNVPQQQRVATELTGRMLVKLENDSASSSIDICFLQQVIYDTR